MYFQIAIDGPSSSGKSSVAKTVARQLGFEYFSTGKMYRAFAYVMQVNRLDVNLLLKVINQINWRFEHEKVFYNNADISEVILNQEIAQLASNLATNPEVRKMAVLRQQALAKNTNIVMDGRDIGTVVLKDAQLKYFLDAKPEIRAQRRAQDLGIAYDSDKAFQELVAEIKHRDAVDTSRTADPLVQAPDAIYIDSSNLTFQQVVELMVQQARTVFKL
ncbi:(d)CMP kinase [Mycoplasmoides pneumoniae]|uniref:Cytidylate kinase n=4 Tax=Mycoplasmoides pneumoniae TaxID=2104 RepID=KCY_MYCPN|nr:(d)CMP kinase [Mycoplasmoides pneumoniae]P75308.1 RecName: Full=Cytidylate kinase; Short=CK; AltName: Full=Cytidine monophosphate kinase; Short=CMP kinase [Mycoplasmoides pneumoniae M129]AAB96013.1 cytidylate kinase [Mycoplasmoides pneumoniae M129]ADK86909.1 cytidylate kinase [Mycoplasmoides pneumoniae FH]AGC04369.1 cytidylate kinase [Mycoplasmoides pneumoniae M129-B7]ALA30349.1 cytidylate kinase [Mycoplasmoides pneumoniae PI 1428]ALA30637.1 cytidylate kinase [Mycoplasmoides pneumoniae 192